MRTRLLFLLFISCLCSCVRAQTFFTGLRNQILAEREDSLTWDRVMLAEDRDNRPFLVDVGPLADGVFPVPAYDRLGKGSFRGLYYVGDRFAGTLVGGKRVVYENFGANASPVNRAWTGDSTDRVFFTLITVTDTIDTTGYTTSLSYIGSRNHPDVVAEGFIASKQNRLDYVAFQTAEGAGYALINMRLFNLADGDVILIAPQKDGTLRSRQLKMAPRTRSGANRFVRERVLTQRKVVRFFTGKGVI